MSALTVAALAVGFVLLIGGGEVLVRGAGGLAATLGISPLVVGLTVVAFATSAPEFAVSVDAALSGYPGLAVGNVVGSNIANILLILGLTAIVAPLVATSRIVRVDIPIMVLFSLVLLLVALDGTISFLDGLLLFAGLVAYVVATIVISRKQSGGRAAAASEEPVGDGAADDSSGSDSADETRSSGVAASHPVLVSSALVIVGVVMLVVGARLLVTAASDLAAAWGMSDLVIGLTVVAVGTSLPELATSMVAAIRGERDLAIGNIVGSNMFNIGAVLGMTSLIAPIEIAAGAIRFDLPIMLAVSLALLPIAFTGLAIARWEGVLFTGFYAAYIAYVVLQAADHDALGPFSAAMLWFVIPITALWLIVLATYELGVLRGRAQTRGRPVTGDSAAQDAAAGGSGASPPRA
ncbi:MAG: calcium/sodium antiporter [Dietzia sp.]|jgi:cation:H+ antiporter|uniref:calcium/sodium antiporter n=1 Tax=Dietzia TaxID=37914 RepID=UPI0015FE23FD|nr:MULTISPECIES: calcium/sodium antiporter [Dietzia]MBB1052213.1 calcium/sodium antiporter [Dietzia sp. CW19]MDO8393303.1 calcium/sodium antiporter [Dietzia sp.]MDX2357155.1 calcium/sodium antiporter [Dietzia sp. PP-33]